jgi:hypothetical protein
LGIVHQELAAHAGSAHTASDAADASTADAASDAAAAVQDRC